MLKVDFKKEDFLEYFGSKEDVQIQMNRCKHCDSKLLLTHLPDYGRLFVQETMRCLDCGQIHKKRLHVLN